MLTERLMQIMRHLERVAPTVLTTRLITKRSGSRQDCDCQKPAVRIEGASTHTRLSELIISRSAAKDGSVYACGCEAKCSFSVAVDSLPEDTLVMKGTHSFITVCVMCVCVCM